MAQIPDSKEPAAQAPAVPEEETVKAEKPVREGRTREARESGSETRASQPRERREREPRQQEDRDGRERRRDDRPKRSGNARELLLEEVPRRAQHADDKLRSHLIGKVHVVLNGKNDRFSFDWSGQVATGSQVSGDESADCTIRLSEDNLMRISSGELNPQIAMLSNKIRVEGKLEFAVYFFNLVAPFQGH